MAELIVERRDDLARALTLDWGKPLHAEAYGEADELVEYWWSRALSRRARPGGG